MMHEAHMAMLADSQGDGARFSWQQAHRRMADYMVAGMLAAPVSPTFTEQRDGILAAAAASDSDDLVTIARAFARRGAGTGAVSPPRNSEDNVGVVESFEVKGEISMGPVSFSEGTNSCDSDGVLDAGENGVVSVEILNTGIEVLANVELTVVADDPSLTFPDGATIAAAELGPFASVTVQVPVQLAADLAGVSAIGLTVTAADPSAITPEVEQGLTLRVNYDETTGVSATDDVEGDLTVWESDADSALGPQEPWVRQQEPGSVNHLWFGADPGSRADEWLVSPTLEVSDSDDLVVKFRHRYKFEASTPPFGGGVQNYDGGVLEISADGGSSWQDVAAYVDPGYPGAITGQSDNPLGGRDAFVAQMDGYPEFAQVELDFGSALAGQSVKFRFRIVTDGAVGDVGWEVDDLEFLGIDNTPFSTLGANNCTPGQAPDAGPGVDAGNNVQGSDGAGCGCRTTVNGGAGSCLLVLIGLVGILRRRRSATP